MGMEASKHRISRTLCACIITLALGSFLCMVAGFERAHAVEGTSTLEAAQITPANKGALHALDVSKSYPAKGTMTMTMSGGDTTTIGSKSIGSKEVWSSSNKKVVKVKSTGKYTAKVTALAPGKATIKAKNDRGTLICKVTVTGTLNKTSLKLSPFSTSKLTFKGLKGHTAKKWTSSNANVEVSSKGVITPKADGKALITCIDNKNCKYHCAVTVSRPNIVCKIGKSFTKASAHGKTFSVSNKSGKTISLNTRVLYYPSFNAYSAQRASAVFYTNLAQKALTIRNKKSGSFDGLWVADVKPTNAAIIATGFKVGNAQYMGYFTPTTGKMLACVRV